MRMLIIILSLSLMTLTQGKPETKTEPSAKVTQTRIVELTLNRSTDPLILFDLAIKDENGKCRVHHHPLKVATIPIIYGLLPGTNKDSYVKAERKEFPNAITQYEAGCLVWGAKEGKVLQCQKCLNARKAWLSDQSGVSGHTRNQR